MCYFVQVNSPSHPKTHAEFPFSLNYPHCNLFCSSLVCQTVKVVVLSCTWVSQLVLCFPLLPPPWASAGTLQQKQDYDFCKWLLTTFYIHLEVCKRPVYRIVNSCSLGIWSLKRASLQRDCSLLESDMRSRDSYLASRVNHSCTNICEISAWDPVGRGLNDVPPVVIELFILFICSFLQTLPGTLRLFVNGEIGESLL